MDEKQLTQEYSNLCAQFGHLTAQIEKLNEDMNKMLKIKLQLIEQKDKLCKNMVSSLEEIEKISLSKQKLGI